MNILVAMLATVGIAALYGLLLRRLALRGLQVHRAFARAAVYAGEEGTLTETVVNRRPLLIPWLLVESRMSDALRFGRQENLEITGERYHRSMFTVMPWQRITRRHRVRFLRRGVYDVGTATLTAGDVSGLFTCSRELAEQARVVVWPKLLSGGQLPVPLVRQLGAWALRRATDDPFLTRGVRAYRPGDPVRDIHWPATARMGEAQVRVHDPSAQIRLLVVINGQLSENQWGDVSESEQDTLEYAISLAATLCCQALRGGMAAGFACNLSDSGGRSACLLPSLEPGKREALLTAMAGIRLRRTLRFETFAQRLDTGGGLSVLLLSAYNGADVQSAAESLRREGNDVLLVPVKGVAHDA